MRTLKIIVGTLLAIMVLGIVGKSDYEDAVQTAAETEELMEYVQSESTLP